MCTIATNRNGVLAAVIGLQLITLLTFYQRGYRVTSVGEGVVSREVATTRNEAPSSIPATPRYKETRDLLSRELNHWKQEYAKRSCEINEMREKMNIKKVDRRLKVSESGGWCLNASKGIDANHVCDHDLAKKLASFLANKYVASFGDGPGVYKKVIDSLGQLKVYDAYDGAPYCAEVSENRVSFMDLTVPQYGLPVYDWIISLEVAEHIPYKYEVVFLDNIARHAKEGIILSWAVPGQGGLAHVNNQPFSHVKQVLSDLGFSHDEASSKVIQDAARVSWLKRNTNVFRRTGGEARGDEA